MALDARIATQTRTHVRLRHAPDHWLNTTVTSASSMSSDASMGPHSFNSWIFKTLCPESFAISNSTAPTLICLSVCQMTSLLLSSTKATPAKTIPLRRIRGGVVGHCCGRVGGVLGAAIASQIRLRGTAHRRAQVHAAFLQSTNISIAGALRPAAARTGARCKGQSKEPTDSV